MKRQRTIRTETSGGVVFQEKTRKVLLVTQRKNIFSLPKGHVDPGETKIEAAVREIYEESGVKSLELIACLGYYRRYRIGLDGLDDYSELKKITIFLFKTSDEILAPQDPENPEAHWTIGSEVSTLLSHPLDKKFFSNFYQRHAKKYYLE